MKLTYMTTDKRRHVERVRDEEEAVKRLQDIPNLMGGTIYNPAPCKSWAQMPDGLIQVNP